MAKALTKQQHLDLYYYMRLNRAVEDTMVKRFPWARRLHWRKKIGWLR